MIYVIPGNGGGRLLMLADWTAITTAAVAVATLVLANATWRLVGFTKEEAEVVRRESEATERQAEITAKALAASSRPWLTTYHADPAPARFHLDVVRNYVPGFEGVIAATNAGQGLAVIPKDSSFGLRGSSVQPES